MDGRAGDGSLDGASGADRLQGETGSDVLRGGFGRNEFVYVSAPGFETGPPENDVDLVEDYARGKDKTYYVVENSAGERLAAFEEPGSGSIDLDLNGNDVLDDGDLYVEIEAVTHGGVTKQSTVIDTASFADLDTGEHALTIFGVTGLTTNDFSF